MLSVKDFATCLLSKQGSVVLRPGPTGDDVQTLLCTTSDFHPLIGASSHNGFKLGERLKLDWDESLLYRLRFQMLGVNAALRAALYDAWSASVYVSLGNAILRLVESQVGA